MSLIDRIRALLTPRPTVGDPSPGMVMDRGEGEAGAHHDAERDQVRRHDHGTPNDPITDRVRPPIE